MLVYFWAMEPNLYQPFADMSFDNSHCFLSGEKLGSTSEKMNVFGDWLIKRYQLNERPFKMLDESMLSYADIDVPCSAVVKETFEDLEKAIENAFLEGYEKVCQLDELKLFQWTAKTVYGIIFREIQSAIVSQSRNGEGFHMSQGLVHKFGMLHTMLQSVIKPIHFDGFKPWSIFICPVDNLENEFSYRDEINTLTFSLRMNDFGIILCLQDNGVNKVYHEEVWNKIEGKKLHPIQFEELCGKIYYSAYLFNRLPEYHIMPTPDGVYLDASPLRGMNSKPLFDDWQNKTYGQVLENFWKKWGFLLLEIIKNPEKPISYLFDDNGDLVNATSINLER